MRTGELQDYVLKEEDRVVIRMLTPIQEQDETMSLTS